MSVRYAPIPNPRTDPDANSELDAAFDDPDDDDDDDDDDGDIDESHLLNPQSSRSSVEHNTLTYDFNTPITDWVQPPPGSPPPATSLALPNVIGNSNGIVPTHVIPPHPSTSWWGRATTFLPSRPQLGQSRSSGRPRIIGGGAANDGVFSNVSAKPTTTGTRVQDGESIYIVPEDASSLPPPSYAVAQADAAPPYHTSLVLLPPSSLYNASALSGSPTQGSVIVDSLPTGTLFAFIWNTLVSTTFQFVGFVLTWVMHTTHAAKFGSRAGLGITLIQWGFGLRARLDDAMNADTREDGTRPSFGSTQEAEDYYNIGLLGNGTAPATIPVRGESQWSNSLLTGPLATEWLSFFLMTIGWFLLLTSTLGFWRVKRWERSILDSHASSTSSTSRGHARTQSEIADDEESRRQSFFDRMGLSRYLNHQRPTNLDGGVGTLHDSALVPAENGRGPGQRQQQQQSSIPWYSDPERARRAREAFAREQRLCEDLRAAGLL